MMVSKQVSAPPAAAVRSPRPHIPRPGAGDQFKQADREESARGGLAKREKENHLILPSYSHCFMR